MFNSRARNRQIKAAACGLGQKQILPHEFFVADGKCPLQFIFYLSNNLYWVIQTLMSDESRYYKIGQERGREGKTTPLGTFNIANKNEARAAQRGWESEQSARAHAEAFEDSRKHSNYSSSNDNYSSGSDYSSSSLPTPGSSDGLDFLKFVIWTVGSWIVGIYCISVMKIVTAFSFLWCVMGLVFLACLPGMITGAIALIAVSIVIAIIVLIVVALIALIRYFIQNPT